MNEAAGRMMAAAASNISGTSYNDMKTQEVKHIGVSPLKEKIEERPIQRNLDENAGLYRVNDLDQAVQLDANVAAKKLTNLGGLPE